MKYQAKLRSLENRRTDPVFLHKSFDAQAASKIFNESYKTIDYPDSVKYTLGAMAEVDSTYTNNTVKEGERIKSQIDELKNNGYNFSFEFQGSTTNNTHIKAHSDIDLLVIQEKYYFNTYTNEGTYQGDWRTEFKSLRQDCYEKLRAIYYAAEVDNSGEFSISVSGGSLKRKVDVVPSCWDLGELYFNNQVFRNKGIRVYKKDMSGYNTNYPFLNNYFIEQKDTYCDSNYRKAVRLLKTLKADSSRSFNFSSYDIVGVLYHMDSNDFIIGQQFLRLVSAIRKHLKKLSENQSLFFSLNVPDNTRRISEKVTMDDLNGMLLEVGELEQDLINDLSRVYKNLEENVFVGRRLYS